MRSHLSPSLSRSHLVREIAKGSYQSYFQDDEQGSIGADPVTEAPNERQRARGYPPEHGAKRFPIIDQVSIKAGTNRDTPGGPSFLRRNNNANAFGFTAYGRSTGPAGRTADYYGVLKSGSDSEDFNTLNAKEEFNFRSQGD